MSMFITTSVDLMAWFLLLPPELWRLILAGLSLTDIAKLDTALLNYEVRFNFLVSIAGLSLEIIPKSKNPQALLSWMVKRQISTKEIEFENNLLTITLLMNSRNALQSLKFFNDRKGIPLDWGYFPSLTALEFYEQPNLEDFSIILISNPQLKKLCFVISEPWVSPPPLTRERFPYLQDLSLSNNRWLNDNHIVELIQGNLNLNYLNISYTLVKENRTIDLIIESYPHLNFLGAVGCAFSNKNEIFTIILNFIVLPSLHTNNSRSHFYALQCLQITVTKFFIQIP